MVFLAYFALAIGTTWPLVVNLDSHFPGDSNDSLHHYWNGWWVKRALRAGQSPYWTPYLHYPDGLSLVSHDIAWFNVGIWLILEPLLGGIATYNLGILISLALCGLAAFLLTYELTGDMRVAFLAGLIYQVWPFRMHQLDRPNLAGTQFIPLFLLFLIRSMESGKWWNGTLTGVFLALTGYTRWQQLIPAAVLGSVYLLCTVPWQLASWRRWGRTLMLAGMIVTLLLVPPVVMLLRQQQSAPAELLRPDEETAMQTDLLAYVTPSRFHSLLRPLTRRAYARYYPERSEPRRYPAYIGVTALALALLEVTRWRRRSLPWVAMALTLMLLALGPVLRVNGRLYPAVPMPYRLAARIQIVRLIRLPDRFNLFLALPVAMLASYGMSRLLGYVEWRGRSDRWIIPAMLAGAFLLEYAVIPIPLNRPETSRFYRQLDENRGEFALLNLPLDQKVSKRYMFAQITHQHPIVQGHVARFPEGAFDYLNEQPWIRTVQESGSLPPTHTDVSRQLETLARDGVRYVVVHKKLTANRTQHWRHYFQIAPHFEDDRVIVYRTAPLAGRDFELAEELTPGVGIITATLSAECVSPGQPLRVDVGWGTTAAPERDLNARLTLESSTGTVRLEQAFPLCEGWPASEWPADSVARGYYGVGIPLTLPGDVYSVSLSLEDPVARVVQGDQASLGRFTVSEDLCAEFLPSDTAEVNALFGSDLRLVGYRLQGEEDQDLLSTLNITLLWRSERLMSTDYKFSVEMVDPDSGQRVARDDAMPLRWAYRTSYWDVGEVVTDAIPLSLEMVPAGQYNIGVTVYDPDTKNRLLVMDSSGRLQANGQLMLPEQGETSPELLRVEVGISKHSAELVAGTVPNPLESELIPQLRLLGYDLDRKALLAGEEVAVQLFWEALGPMSQDYELRLALVDHDGAVYRQQDFDLVSIDYPTTEWRSGDVLQDWYTLLTIDNMPSGDVSLMGNLLDELGDPVLTSPVGIADIWVQAVEPSFERPDDVDPLDIVELEDKVALLGYDVPPVARCGDGLAVTLYWQALHEMDISYKVFVHLHDASGRILAQRDRLPGLGARPTNVWEKGEVVLDRYYVPIRSDIPAGTYQLAVGLYDAQTGRRLATIGSDGNRLPEDRISLGRVEVRS
jgi:hypothetical protein